MSLFELLFNNMRLSFSTLDSYARYDDEGYPIEDNYFDDDEDDEDYQDDEPWEDDDEDLE
ncbi:MAG: hypothetical protein PHC89_01590 [Candidatus Pacebacteria bacterium]|nr:hypothetical protein [Candidatus Paceibacterota bacterium]